MRPLRRLVPLLPWVLAAAAACAHSSFRARVVPQAVWGRAEELAGPPRDLPAWAPELERVSLLAGAQWHVLSSSPDACEEGAYLLLQFRHLVPGNPRIRGKLGLAYPASLYSETLHVSSYLLEGFDRELGLLFEDAKLGSYFVRRYYLVTARDDASESPALWGDCGVIVVAAAARRPLRWVEYRALREFVKALVP